MALANDPLNCKSINADLLENYIPWTAPSFENQTNTLGYADNTFKVEDRFKSNVDFWISIYTKYSTTEGVIHNIDNPSIVYETLDFNSIIENNNISAREKEKAKENLIQQAKERIAFSLTKLSTNPSASDLNSYDEKIKSSFPTNTSSDDFANAAHLNQIRFQLGQSNRMKQAIQDSGRFLPYIEDIFRGEGLPLELTRLPFVESSFNVFSISKVGASGIWQIMPSVARGQLKRNNFMDYRNHPLEASKMAANILKSNYIKLNNWALALTAYNHGANGMARLVVKNKTNDLHQIIKEGDVTNSFGFASRNFYYTFLAALEVEKNADKYFNDICKVNTLQLDNIKTKSPIGFTDIIEFFKGDIQLAMFYNPHFTKRIYLNKSKIQEHTKIIIPSSDKYLFLAKENQISIKGSSSNKKVIFAKKSNLRKYKISRGDTLIRIAKQFNVPLNKLLALNDLKHKNDIKAGQLIFISE